MVTARKGAKLPDTSKPVLAPNIFKLVEEHGKTVGLVFEGISGKKASVCLPLPRHEVTSVAYDRLMSELEELFSDKSFWIDGRTFHVLTVKGLLSENRLHRLFVWNEEEVEKVNDRTTEEVQRASKLLRGIQQKSKNTKPAKNESKSGKNGFEIDIDSPSLLFLEDIQK